MTRKRQNTKENTIESSFDAQTKQAKISEVRVSIHKSKERRQYDRDSDPEESIVTNALGSSICPITRSQEKEKKRLEQVMMLPFKPQMDPPSTEKRFSGVEARDKMTSSTEFMKGVLEAKNEKIDQIMNSFQSKLAHFDEQREDVRNEINISREVDESSIEGDFGDVDHLLETLNKNSSIKLNNSRNQETESIHGQRKTTEPALVLSDDLKLPFSDIELVETPRQDTLGSCEMQSGISSNKTSKKTVHLTHTSRNEENNDPNGWVSQR